MTICLRDGVAMSATLLCAFTIGIDYAAVGVRMMIFEPGQQCRTKIETDVLVVVDESFVWLSTADADKRICSITFEMNALVPIVKRRGARLFFNHSRPRIFARRLIEVTVNDQCGHSQKLFSHKKAQKAATEPGAVATGSRRKQV